MYEVVIENVKWQIMESATFLEKGTMTTISDTLTSQLQMYINNNMVQSHIQICPKPDFMYDNLFDCTGFNNKVPSEYKPGTIGENNSWDYGHHNFTFGRCITCPLMSQTSTDNDKDLNFTLLRNIATHIKARAVYKCCHCKANFEEKYDLVNHIKDHNEIHAQPTNNCNPNNHVHDNNLSVGTSAHQIDSKSRFICQYCNTSYSRKSNLNTHMRIHSDIKKPFACEFCDASYSRKANLNAHIKVHIAENGNKPFSCSMCDAAYSRKSSLDSHIRIHTDGSKPFRCDFCGATYSRKTNLNAHVKIHTIGRQPFNCEFCNASYSRKTNLNAHVRTHTSGKVSFKCDFCSVQYSRKTNLNVHIRTHTGEKPYKCKQCPECFGRRTDLNTHMKSQHPLEQMVNKICPQMDYHLIQKPNCCYQSQRQNDNRVTVI